MMNKKILTHALGIFAVCAAFVFQTQTALATTYTVTTNADTGAGSLRQAITDANANAGLDTIDFDAGLSGGTITLLTVLPWIIRKSTGKVHP